MKFLIFYSFFIVLIISLDNSRSEYCAKGLYPANDRLVKEEYEVNLDLPPSQRWQNISILHQHKLRAILKQFKSVLLGVSKYAQVLIDYVDKNLGGLVALMPHPFDEELQGYATNSNVNLGELFFYNIFYEFFTVCTSVVARDAEGHIYHARNLDFGIFMGWDSKEDKWQMSKLLRNSTFQLRWTKGGKTLFKSVNFAGFIGVLTGIKPRLFAFSLNERFNEDGGFLGLFKWLLGYRQSAWMSWISRSLMETSSSYEEALQMLTSKELIAPVYFILSGPSTHQACVITRSRLKTLDVWHIGTDGYNRTDNKYPNQKSKNYLKHSNQNISHFSNKNELYPSIKNYFKKLNHNNNDNHDSRPSTKLTFSRHQTSNKQHLFISGLIAAL